jgi:4-diphosphocytidyl-2-C-methyl-D-erythritol kinase
MPTLRVEALAKVNLGLRVLYRRPDGFHELRTVFQTISLADRVELEYRRARAGVTVELECNRAELAGADNLAARAACALLEAAGSSGRVRLSLEKRTPVGAGLGGGSSDAAAVLLALGSLLRARPAWPLLHKVAAGLGSDVPFFLLGGRALGLGSGTEIYPLDDAPGRWMVVAAPAIEVSTAEAYRRLGANLTTGSWEDKIDRFCSSACASERGAPAVALEEVVAGLENDFEPVVFQMHPKLQILKERLKRLGACPALLSGSGSALFGVFADRRQALRARDSLDLEDGRCFVVKTVSRAGYRARWRKWLRESKPAR